MKALVWQAAERMEWLEREIPVPEPGEVLLKVEAVGICGSEIEGYLGHNSLRVPPLIMGHEFCAVVADAGRAGGRWREGGRVVVNPLLSCGVCVQCRRGRVMLCSRRQIVGIHRPGAFAHYVAVPESALIEIPDGISPYRAALSEPLACAYRATRRALRDHPLSPVVVFGAGGIGLLCAMAAKRLGASAVMIVDLNEDRLRTAASLGIDFTVNPAAADLREEVRRAFGPEGFDVAVDAAGFQPTRAMAAKLLNPGGTWMNIGLGIDDTTIPFNHLIRSEIEVLGSFCYSHDDFRQAVALLTGGRITEEGWTEIRPMSAGQQAFDDLVKGRVHAGKIFLVPDGGEAYA